MTPDEDAGAGAAQRGRVDAGAARTASQAVSSSSRCCGSVARASRGLMPKKAASNSAGVVQEPAVRGCSWCQGDRGRGRRGRRCPSRGPAGNSVIASTPVGDKVPQLGLGAVDAARVAAGHADDRHWLPRCLGKPQILLPQTFVLKQRRT